jgi:RNA polymerase primary sigma factor
MSTTRTGSDSEGLATLDDTQTRLLSASEERALLRELGECREKLAAALDQIPGVEVPEGGHDDPKVFAELVATTYLSQPLLEASLGAIHVRYRELRGRLAMANVRLVAHVAKRFRERGVSYSDLMQEGFCGLLEAIDRFDTRHQTKLATYATWWIRQAMQRAVAAGAYPVRLSPRHLRQLARSQEGVDDAGKPLATAEAGPEILRRIHTATRPTVSLDATLDAHSSFSLLQTMSDPEGDQTGEVDTDETIDRLMAGLRPREQQVLALRFGLGGGPRLSLSQVGKVLEVSKERVRQIQDRALEKLRGVAGEDGLPGKAEGMVAGRPSF